MPTDKIKQPDKFPTLFHIPFELGVGTWELFSSQDRKECKAVARKFCCFLRSIRAYPGHRFNQILRHCRISTRTKQDRIGSYVLYIEVQSDLQNPITKIVLTEQEKILLSGK